MSSAIEKYLGQIRGIMDPAGIYAYRGQQDWEWPLYSAATRRLVRELGDVILADPHFGRMYVTYHKNTLIEPARSRGFGQQDGGRLSDLQLVAKLQHFGAPTGLLDFSWSPLVALWFASEDTGCDGETILR